MTEMTFLVATAMCVPLTGRVALEQMPRDDEPLQLVGAAADEEQRGVAIIAFDRKVLREPVAAEDAHGLERDFGGGLRRKQLRHARLHVAPLAAVLLRRRRVDEQASG